MQCPIKLRLIFLHLKRHQNADFEFSCKNIFFFFAKKTYHGLVCVGEETPPGKAHPQAAQAKGRGSPGQPSCQNHVQAAQIDAKCQAY